MTTNEYDFICSIRIEGEDIDDAYKKYHKTVEGLQSVLHEIELVVRYSDKS